MPITIGNITVDDVTAGELVLEELADRIPSPVGSTTIGGVAAGMLAGRAPDIHADESSAPSAVVGRHAGTGGTQRAVCVGCSSDRARA